jgi:hypothetical protein
MLPNANKRYERVVLSIPVKAHDVLDEHRFNLLGTNYAKQAS